MMRHVTPEVGNWYRDLQSGNVFEVVAWDRRQRTIEQQFIDGELGECDIENWSLLQLEEIPEPEDWRNPYEMDGEDSLDPDEPFHPDDWTSPLAMIEPEFELGLYDTEI